MDLKEIGINTRSCVDSGQNTDYCRPPSDFGIEPPGSISHVMIIRFIICIIFITGLL